MKTNYIMTVAPGPGTSEDFLPGRKLSEGLSCSGFFLVAFDGKDPAYDAVAGVNVMQLANLLAYSTSPTVGVLRQALAIAGGLRKARLIRENERLAGKLRAAFRTGDGEAGDEWIPEDDGDGSPEDDGETGWFDEERF